jgi:hypothetical protein
MRTREDKKIFDCVKCNNPVYRLGSRVNQEQKYCGKCVDEDLCQEPIKIPTELTQEKTLLTSDINHTVQQKINYYQERLNIAKEMAVIFLELPFDELWTLATKKHNQQ